MRARSMQGASTARQCNLLYGTTAVLASAAAHPNGLVAHGLACALEMGIVEEDDNAVVVSHVGGRFEGTSVQLARVGDMIHGEPASELTAVGQLS
jgi:hypothetical protein